MRQQILLHGTLRRLLHLQIHRGVNLQTLGIKGLATVILFQIATNLLGKVRCADCMTIDAGMDGQLLRQRLVRLGTGDILFVDHLSQHIFLPFPGFRQILVRGVTARRLRQTGQKSTFSKSQLFDILRKIVLCRRLHSVRTMAKEDLVEIKIKNLLLGQGIFDPPGKDGFLEFTGEFLFRGQEETLGHLLGNGAPPLHNAAGHDILHRSTKNRDEIDTGMLVKIGIFRRNKGLRQLLRQPGNRDKDPSFPGKFGNLRAVIGKDPGDDWRAIVRQTLDFGQGTIDIKISADQSNRHQPDQQGNNNENDLERSGNFVRTCHVDSRKDKKVRILATSAVFQQRFYGFPHTVHCAIQDKAVVCKRRKS